MAAYRSSIETLTDAQIAQALQSRHIPARRSSAAAPMHLDPEPQQVTGTSTMRWQWRRRAAGGQRRVARAIRLRRQRRATVEAKAQVKAQVVLMVWGISAPQPSRFQSAIQSQLRGERSERRAAIRAREAKVKLRARRAKHRADRTDDRATHRANRRARMVAGRDDCDDEDEAQLLARFAAKAKSERQWYRVHHQLLASFDAKVKSEHVVRVMVEWRRCRVHHQLPPRPKTKTASERDELIARSQLPGMENRRRRAELCLAQAQTALVAVDQRFDWARALLSFRTFISCPMMILHVDNISVRLKDSNTLV